MLNLTEHEFPTAYKNLNAENNDTKLLAVKLSDFVFIMLINVKMPTIFGILTFKSMINFMLI